MPRRKPPGEGDKIRFKPPHGARIRSAVVVATCQEADGSTSFQIEPVPGAGPRGEQLDYVHSDWLR